MTLERSIDEYETSNVEDDRIAMSPQYQGTDNVAAGIPDPSDPCE